MHGQYRVVVCEGRGNSHFIVVSSTEINHDVLIPSMVIYIYNNSLVEKNDKGRWTYL